MPGPRADLPSVPSTPTPVPGRPLSTASAGVSRRAGLAVLAVLLLGTALSIVVFLVARGRIRHDRRLAFEQHAAQVSATLQSGFDLPLEVVQSLPALFSASSSVTRHEFEVFARSALSRHPSIYALEWIPLVTAEQRQEVEARARSEGLNSFLFREVGTENRMIPAAQRSEYLPILFMVPSNEVALGFDVASDAARRAPADLARDLGRAVASPRIRLVEDPPDVYSVAVFAPVYEGETLPSTLEERRRRFRGSAAEVFRIRPVVEHGVRHLDPAGLNVALVDETAPASLELLYESREGLLARPPSDDVFSWSKSFPYAERRWEIRFWSTPSYASAQTPWDVLAWGLLWTALGCVVIYAVKMILGLRRQVRAAQQLGQYTLDEKLGEGGMGAVYRAHHAMLRRPTAIKIMLGRRDDKHLARFEREVQMTSRLTHPNTIAVYDYGRTPDGVFYYAMEYLEGITLEELVELDGTQPVARVLHLLRQLCGAIAEAHQVGLIHRDIKPANVMLVQRGGIPDFVKVLDFGLVKDLRGGAASLSVEGALLGTPLYLAPEAITKPDEVGPAADLYAIGAVGYYLLAGVPVFLGQNLVEICGQHLHHAPIPPSVRAKRDIPKPIEDMILRCLAKAPGDRPPSAEDLLEQIEGFEVRIGVWRTQQARAWWDAHGQAAVARLRSARARKEREEPAGSSWHNLPVDFAQREPRAPKPAHNA